MVLSVSNSHCSADVCIFAVACVLPLELQEESGGSRWGPDAGAGSYCSWSFGFGLQTDH